jgi:hypothetical protein
MPDCAFRIPDDAALEDMRGLPCVLEEHDGDEHIVGVSGPGYAMLWHVNAATRTLREAMHARLDRDELASYVALRDMAATLAAPLSEIEWGEIEVRADG